MNDDGFRTEDDELAGLGWPKDEPCRVWSEGPLGSCLFCGWSRGNHPR